VKLAIVQSHPTQYYSPWFRYIYAQGGIELRVLYLWEFGVTRQTDRQFGTAFQWDVDLLSGYDHEFVPNVARAPGTHHVGGLDNPALTKRLAAWRPDALLLFGYKWKSHLRAIVWARRKRVPLLFRGDSHFIGRGEPPFLKRWPLAILYRQFRAFLHVGAANREYFLTLGVPDDRLFFAPHSVDDSLFDPNRSDHRAAAEKLRRELDLPPDRKVILFAGKFVSAKQPLELLRAFITLKDNAATLLFVGDGPLKAELQSLAAENPSADVRFLPFANQSEMPARYLLADLFVLPSRGLYETWGLAVNEAMHMGVPALVSERVGCQRDLVEDGVTGWVFSHDSKKDLQCKLSEALDVMQRRQRLETIRENIRVRIGRYTFQKATDGLARAVESLEDHRIQRPSTTTERQTPDTENSAGAKNT
jgi:glycosyltransferase involved in cell wall biosynthesis